MIYIDGYNFLFSLNRSITRLEESRQNLLEDYSDILQLLPNEVSFIFDAHYREDNPLPTYFRSLRVIFTDYQETADERILQMIQENKHPEKVTVVTSDKGLANQAKLLSAQVMSIDKFLSMLSKKMTKRQKKSKKAIDYREHPLFDNYLKIFEERWKKFDQND